MKTPLLRRLRLVSGVVLFAYVVGHLANLSLGLVSLQTMEAARPAFMWLWQNPVGLALLYGSMVLHMVLGLLALYQRGTLRMSSSDSLQLVLALALPPLMILHLLGTRAASTIAEFQPTYPWLMLIYWKWVPASGLRQVLVVMAAWIHGCMGMYYWMHVQGWWPRWRGLLYPFAFLVPVAALLGFVEAGKETLALAEDESFMGSVFASVGELSEQTIATLVQTENRLIAMYMTILALVLVARAVRLRVGSGARTVQITYLDGPTVTAPVGLSLLEISRSQDVSHISMCGGKARCGTCRVRVVEGGSTCRARIRSRRTPSARCRRIGRPPCLPGDPPGAPARRCPGHRTPGAARRRDRVARSRSGSGRNGFGRAGFGARMRCSR